MKKFNNFLELEEDIRISVLDYIDGCTEIVSATQIGLPFNAGNLIHINSELITLHINHNETFLYYGNLKDLKGILRGDYVFYLNDYDDGLVDKMIQKWKNNKNN